GMPIWKIARSSVLFAVWLPEPLTVATWIEHSFTMGAGSFAVGAGAGSVVVWGMGSRAGKDGIPRPIRGDCTDGTLDDCESTRRTQWARPSAVTRSRARA